MDLYVGLREQLQNLREFQPHWDIVVRVYIKLDKLAEAYTDAQIIDRTATFRDFYRGFNEVYPLFDAVDAGTDKEGADTKIKGKIDILLVMKKVKADWLV